MPKIWDRLEIFNRVNTSGRKIESCDIAFARLRDEEPTLAKTIAAFQKEWAPLGFDLNNRVLINSFLIINTILEREWYTTTRKPDEQIRNYLDDAPKVKKDWQHTLKGVENALEFLRRYTGFDSDQFLASENTIAVMAGYFKNKISPHRLSKRKTNIIKKWLYRTITQGRYSKTTNFYEDIRSLENGKTPKVPKSNPSEYTEAGIVDIMYALGRENEMKDYYGESNISWAYTPKKHRIQIDHIYPRSRLTEKPIKNKIDEKVVENIGNKAFVFGKTNASKNKDFPGEKIKNQKINQWIDGFSLLRAYPVRLK